MNTPIQFKRGVLLNTFDYNVNYDLGSFTTFESQYNILNSTELNNQGIYGFTISALDNSTKKFIAVNVDKTNHKISFVRLSNQNYFELLFPETVPVSGKGDMTIYSNYLNNFDITVNFRLPVELDGVEYLPSTIRVFRSGFPGGGQSINEVKNRLYFVYSDESSNGHNIASEVKWNIKATFDSGETFTINEDFVITDLENDRFIEPSKCNLKNLFITTGINPNNYTGNITFECVVSPNNDIDYADTCVITINKLTVPKTKWIGLLDEPTNTNYVNIGHFEMTTKDPNLGKNLVFKANSYYSKTRVIPYDSATWYITDAQILCATAASVSPLALTIEAKEEGYIPGIGNKITELKCNLGSMGTNGYRLTVSGGSASDVDLTLLINAQTFSKNENVSVALSGSITLNYDDANSNIIISFKQPKYDDCTLEFMYDAERVND